LLCPPKHHQGDALAMKIRLDTAMAISKEAEKRFDDHRVEKDEKQSRPYPVQ